MRWIHDFTEGRSSAPAPPADSLSDLAMAEKPSSFPETNPPQQTQRYRAAWPNDSSQFPCYFLQVRDAVQSSEIGKCTVKCSIQTVQVADIKLLGV
jgi:hypothetical protein